MTTDDVLFYPAVRELPPAIADDIRSRLTEKTVERHLILFREGAPCNCLYLLRQGRVKVSKSSSDGRELALAILRPGEIFDITPIFDDGPHVVTAQALDNLVLHVIAKQDLLSLVQQHPVLATTLLTHVFGTLRQLADLVEEVSAKSVTARLASFLLAQSAGSGRINLDLSQSEVAALLGTRREVLARALDKLDEDGIVRATYPHIAIIDPDRLRHVA